MSSVRVEYDLSGPREGCVGEEASKSCNGGCRLRRSIIQRPKHAYLDLNIIRTLI